MVLLFSIHVTLVTNPSGNANWGIANKWILSSGGVRKGRVCYHRGHPFRFFRGYGWCCILGSLYVPLSWLFATIAAVQYSMTLMVCYLRKFIWQVNLPCILLFLEQLAKPTISWKQCRKCTTHPKYVAESLCHGKRRLKYTYFLLIKLK